MALEGTVKDFALPDIFQLIGIQRKTGILLLSHDQETVTIKFLEGQVVEVDTRSQSLEDRLGSVLVRTGRITAAQLAEALEIQGRTLQRLGHILVKREFISEDELVEALRIQSSQIIYRLFRWRDGRYHFDTVENLDYDQPHSTPVSSETILMEGARMVDEWPIIERRIPSDTMILRRTTALEALDLEPVGPAAAGLPELEFAIDLDLQLDEVAAARPAVSPEESMVLSLVDGRRSVRQIADLLPIPEFETFRALSEMLARNLLERVEAARPGAGAAGAVQGRTTRILGWLGKLGLALTLALVLAGLPANRFTPWQALGRSAASERLRLHAAMARLEQIEKAVQVFYLDTGSFPQEAAALVRYGYLGPSALVDPWGRPYRFTLSTGGYQIVGLDAAGEGRPELTVSRSFSEVQQLLVQTAESN